MEEITCATMYSPDSVKNVSLSEEMINDLSYSPHTEITLSRLPINLYRHSELDSFCIFSKYRQKLASNLMKEDEVDFEPQFSYFDVEEASNKYKRIKRKNEKKTT